MKNIIFSAIAMFLPSLANASLFCGPLDESREWFESKVTEERANISLEKLRSLNGDVASADFIVAENALAVIEARMYIAFINESKEQFGEYDPILVSQYCSFLQENGYFKH